MDGSTELLTFSLDRALTADEKRTLALHVCDEAFTLNSASGPSPDHDYTWASTGLDWSPHAERTLYISRDVTAPSLTLAAVNGTALTLTFDEALGAASALANSAFTVKKGPYGGAQTTATLSGTPAISGNTVSLTLAAAVMAVDTNVTVSYTRPGTGSNNALADLRGNAVADFTDAPANNLLSDTTPPALDTALLAEDGVTLTLTYNEALYAASTPAATAFTVTATPAGGRAQTLTVDNVSVTGSTVVLTLAGPRAHNDAVTVAYTTPGSGAVIEDASGNDAATFPARAVTNDSLAPRVTIAAVHPDATPGIANPEFRVTRSNTAAPPLTVTLTVTQAADYLDATTHTITIPAYQDTATMTFVSTLFDSNVSGDLVLAVAGGADHLPGVTGDAATVAMKLPAAGTGPIAALDYGQSLEGGWSVLEGDILSFILTLTTAANVARPRTDNLAYELATEAGTAAHNVDYTHTAGDVPFPAAGWTGSGPYTQTVTFPVNTLQDTEYEGAERFNLALNAALETSAAFYFQQCSRHPQRRRDPDADGRVADLDPCVGRPLPGGRDETGDGGVSTAT